MVFYGLERLCGATKGILIPNFLEKTFLRSSQQKIQEIKTIKPLYYRISGLVEQKDNALGFIMFLSILLSQQVPDLEGIRLLQEPYDVKVTALNRY